MSEENTIPVSLEIDDTYVFDLIYQCRLLNDLILYLHCHNRDSEAEETLKKLLNRMQSEIGDRIVVQSTVIHGNDKHVWPGNRPAPYSVLYGD